MTEANKEKTGEGSAKSEVDLTKYVPKEDFEKVSKDAKAQVATLQAELDQAKLTLLDPDYIAFQETKRGRALGNKIEKAEDKLANASSGEIEALRNEINTLRATQENVLAVLELQSVEKRYDDFDDYRDTVKKILETSTTPLTIEQAYLLAKGQSKTEKSDSEKGKAAKSSSEKPSGTVPGESLQQKNFKDKTAAGLDAWDKAVGAGKDWL